MDKRATNPALILANPHDTHGRQEAPSNEWNYRWTGFQFKAYVKSPRSVILYVEM